MSLWGLIPAGIGLLGNLFGKKKPTQMQAREDPMQAKQRQMMYQLLANLMRQGPMGMGPTQQGLNVIQNRFLPPQQQMQAPPPMMLPRGAMGGQQGPPRDYSVLG